MNEDEIALTAETSKFIRCMELTLERMKPQMDTSSINTVVEVNQDKFLNPGNIPLECISKKYDASIELIHHAAHLPDEEADGTFRSSQTAIA